MTLEVVDFTWDQICAFIANWFDTQPDRARQLRQTLSGNLRMQTLATNPLVLSLIVIVFDRDLELPERRAELYKRCAEVMLREWDAHRGIRRFSKVTTDRKRDLLQEVAWHFHRTGKRYFPKQELVALIAGYLPSVGIAAEESEAILNEIAAQYGLLKEQAHDWYGFLHLTMQEYFAAMAVASRPGERVDFVVRHRHDPWWEEVLLLLAGQLPDVTGRLLGILGISITNRTYGPARDDVFASDLLLAARCLVGSPRIEMTSLRSDILNQVEALLVNAPSAFHRERAAAALAEIGTEGGGHLLALARLDGAPPASAHIAPAKARTAALGRRESKEYEDRINGGRVAFLSAPELAGALEGGVPIMREGHCLGAVGVSGVQPAQDVQVARAGIAVLGM